MLIIITGPPGAGKSSISKLLANKFPKSVNLREDTLKDFIVGGNFAPWDLSVEAKKLHKLNDKILEVLIEQYIKAKYIIILDGVFSSKDLNKFKNKFSQVFGFILLPSLAETRIRDKSRKKDQQVSRRVKLLYDSFSQNTFADFVIIDSTNQTPRQTSQQILLSLKAK